MGLRFIYGRAGSGKSNTCILEIKKRIEEGAKNPLILLVPEQFSFQAEKNLIDIISERGMMSAEVLSFTRMAYRVLSSEGGIIHKHINSAGRVVLIYKIMDALREKLSVFSKAGKQQGFVNIMSDIITELKRYDVNTDMLEAAALKLNDGDTLKGKISDIALVFSEFQNELHKKYIDNEDELSMLSQKLTSCTMFDDAEIWLDEFTSFTPLQYDVIEKLMKKAKRINIALTSDVICDENNIENTDVFFPIKNTERKLIKLAEKNNISYEKPLFLKEAKRFKNDELKHIEKFYFSYPYVFYNKETSYVKLFKAAGIYTEVENCAREIISLVRDKNMRFNDIAVVTRDLSRYEELTRVIFTQYGIPFFIDSRRDINNNPVIVFARSVIDILRRGFTYEAVFRYLKCGLSDIEREDIDILENYVLANGIKGTRWTDKKEWASGAGYGQYKADSEYDKEVITKVNEIKEKITAPIKKFKEEISKKRTVKELCTACFLFLKEQNIPSRIEGFIEYFNNNGMLDYAREYSQIWNMFMELLDQLVYVFGEEDITLEKFSKIFETGIGEYKVGIIPPSLDQVLVGNIERIKSHEVRAVFILGVNDGIFPKSSNEEGILSDSDRLELKNYGIEIAEDTKTRAFEEQFLIYTTLSTSTNYMYISYAIADAQGKSLRPSIIISRLKKLFPKLKEESDIIERADYASSIKNVSSPNPTFNELVKNIKMKNDGREVNPLWKNVYEWYMSSPEYGQKCKRIFEGFDFNNKLESISKEKIASLYKIPLKISVSRLEKYVQCPFSYFVQYGLYAKERKMYEFSNPDIGVFMHEVLERFSTILKKENMSFKDIDIKWIETAVALIIDEIISENPGIILNSSYKYRFFTESLKRILVKSISTISLHFKKGNFETSDFEKKFKSIMQLPSGASVEISGRIDRVDELEIDGSKYIRVIDYKSGSKAFKLSDVYYGIQLQLLLYLDILLSNENKYKDKKVLPGAILYFRLDDPMISSEGDMDTDKLNEEILKKLKMNGIILEDTRIIREMDKDINGYSLIIPAQIKNDGSLGSKSSTASITQFELLRDYVKKITMDICTKMLNGNISINPLKKTGSQSGSGPCSYCSFSEVCSFDPSFEENKYKIIKDKSDPEVFELMKTYIEAGKGENSNAELDMRAGKSNRNKEL